MRKAAVLLLALAACTEPSVVQAPPMDRFLFPVSVAALPATGRSALLVASSNYDLHYDGASGGTLLSVDPRLYADGGSAGHENAAGAFDWALVKVPDTADAGARIGSFAGQIAVASASNCPGFAAPQPYLAVLPTRFDGVLQTLPVAADGALQACPAGGCLAYPDVLLKDPWTATVACRKDGTRRSLFVGYQATANKSGYIAGSTWVEEFSVDELATSPATATGRAIELGPSTVMDVAYDAERDRLVVLAKPYYLVSPMILVDLPACSARLDPTPESGSVYDGACPQPTIHFTDVATLVPGADVQAVALSNPQAGLGRRAYVAARLYDPAAGAILGYRPSSDISGGLIVMDLEDGKDGKPSMKIIRVVPIALGPALVRVLPVRPHLASGAPRRDVVVVTSTGDGVVTVYDDDEALVARSIHLDALTGAPQAGREPFGLAVDPTMGVTTGTVSRVYVSSYLQSIVSLLDVPLLEPGQAHFLRDGVDATGAHSGNDMVGRLVRIGGIQ